jgi:hypothetical protein
MGAYENGIFASKRRGGGRYLRRGQRGIRLRARGVVAALGVCLLAAAAASAAVSATSGPIKWGKRVVVYPGGTTFDALKGVSCPTKTLCATVGGSPPHVFVSTHPTGGASAWFTAKASDANSLRAVSCVPTLCVAVDSHGGIVYSTHPSSKTKTWSGPTTIDGVNTLDSISCPSAHLCVAGDSAGQVITSTDPTGGPAKWSPAFVDSVAFANIDAISCPKTSFCVAVDNKGNSLSSTHPTGGAPAWKFHAGVDSTNALEAVSCPSTKLCVAVDNAVSAKSFGRVLTSTKPTASTPWKVQLVDKSSNFPEPFGVSCPSTSLCVVVDDNGYAFTSTRPTGGKTAWKRSAHTVDPRAGFNALSCSPTSTTVCVGVDNLGGEVAGTGHS